MAARTVLLLLIGAALLTVSCTENQPLYTQPVIIDVYPEITEGIPGRNTDYLINYLEHEDPHARNLAWRAVSKAPDSLVSPDSLIEIAIAQNDRAAWLAISHFELSSRNSQRIEEIFSDSPSEFFGICEIYRRQGGVQELSLILDVLPNFQHPELCTTAAGRILAREEVPEELLDRLLTTAFETKSPTVRRNLLYGFYRSPINRPENRPGLQTNIAERWLELRPGSETSTDQYMIGILGAEGASLFMDHVSVPDEVYDQQLLIEFIRALDVTGIKDLLEFKVVLDLLDHENPTVVTEMLERLKNASDLDESSLNFLYRQYVRGERNPVIFLTGLELMQLNGRDITPLREKLAFVEKENPYLTNKSLNIYLEDGEEALMLGKIRAYLEEEGIRGLHSAQVLSGFWVGLDEEDRRIDEIRSIVRDGAINGDAGVVRGLNLLLVDETIIKADDYDWLLAIYDEALSEGKSDKAALLSNILESRFPETFEAEEFNDEGSFRMPDWERLQELGSRPYWRLETNKGEVVVRLDPLSAPFTVSSIDSLTRAGAYDGVAFHRVVHNFVIQGGDVGRGDGFGGPGYTIPTEPSLKSFERGAVGIASSGTDTEGSQYFVMHQWAPHLDADYTLFGTVVSGMDVVDRIQVGDLVIAASISAR